MARVNLDAMIPRADFAIEGEDRTLDLFSNFPISNLDQGSPIRTLLRKPDFQRETNHWDAEQIATFICSFVDNELIPSLILWKSSTYIFVIDGGHRLSALRAWMEDDYGDGPISQKFYGGEITEDQKKAAKRTRKLIEQRVGRFATLKSIVNAEVSGDSQQSKRAGKLFTRALSLQWVQGTASVAETSFFKINSQGTPLDETEEMLLINRKKPISISARAILRAGTGNKYWSAFDEKKQSTIEETAKQLYNLLFEPEVDQPLKTLDIPLAGSVSPVDALALLIELLLIADSKDEAVKGISQYDDDVSGDTTIAALKSALNLVSRVTSNRAGSLGLHPAVYFYNEKGKHSRFLFLGTMLLFTVKLRNNDSAFFAKFTQCRPQVEKFLIDNKSLIGILLQNMSKRSRVGKMKDLLDYLVKTYASGAAVKIEDAISHLGAKGRIIDVTTTQGPIVFSEETKSAIFVRQSIETAMKCPLCGGLLDPSKSVSYDHIKRVREGGLGHIENGQLVHPYCNTAVKN